MPLFDPMHRPTASAEDRAAIAHDFLRRCREWAVEVELPKRRQAALQSDSPEAAAKLHQWLTYLQFTDHAIEEVEQGKLDHWFSEDPGPSTP